MPKAVSAETSVNVLLPLFRHRKLCVPPALEAEFAAIRERVAVHEIPGDGGGAAIEHVMRSVRPDAVIFGEAPLRGPFRLSHRIATSLFYEKPL